MSFEAHLTLADGIEPDAALRAWAHARDLRVLSVELARGTTRRQLMLTARFEATHTQALLVLAGLAEDIRTHSVAQVTRRKLELAVDDCAEPPSGALYLEHHVKVRTGAPRVPVLSQLGLRHAAHLSRNAFKRLPNGVEERFLTQRFEVAAALPARRALLELVSALEDEAIQVLKSEREWVLYDDNLMLDHGWLKESS